MIEGKDCGGEATKHREQRIRARDRALARDLTVPITSTIMSKSTREHLVAAAAV